MKNGLRFVDCDMHIMEPVDLFDKYLDREDRDRVVLPVDQGQFKRGMIVIDVQGHLARPRDAAAPEALIAESQDGDLAAVVGLPHGGGRISQLRQ